MPPGLIYVRSTSMDIHIRYVNVGPRIIDPTMAVPAMVDDMVVIPVKIHAQPTPNG